MSTQLQQYLALQAGEMHDLVVMGKASRLAAFHAVSLTKSLSRRKSHPGRLRLVHARRMQRISCVPRHGSQSEHLLRFNRKVIRLCTNRPNFNGHDWKTPADCTYTNNFDTCPLQPRPAPLHRCKRYRSWQGFAIASCHPRPFHDTCVAAGRLRAFGNMTWSWFLIAAANGHV